MTPSSSIEPASPHSPLRHLAYALWLNRDPEHCYMTMFTAYHDASGHPDNPGAMYVSGVVSSVPYWLEFEGRWHQLLKKHHLSFSFHMTDWVVGEGDEYREWLGDQKRQTAFLTDVRTMIAKYTLITVSQGIVLDDFTRLHGEFVLPDAWTYPLSYCAIGCYHSLDDWRAATLGKDDVIKYVYESGDQDWGHFATFAKENYGFSPIPQTKNEAAPLQLADIISWEHRKWLHETAAKSGRKPRKSLLALAGSLVEAEKYWNYGHYEKMAKGCDEMGIPRRIPRASQ